MRPAAHYRPRLGVCLVNCTNPNLWGDGIMSDSVYKVIELVGTSEKSWEDAARNAVETAGRTLKNLRIAEVKQLDLKVEDGCVVGYRARVSLSFKYETEPKPKPRRK